MSQTTTTTKEDPTNTKTNGISTKTMETATTNTTVPDPPVDFEEELEEEDDSFDEVMEVDMSDFNLDSDDDDERKKEGDPLPGGSAAAKRRAPRRTSSVDSFDSTDLPSSSRRDSSRPSLQRGNTKSSMSLLSIVSNVPTKVPKNLKKWPRCHACCWGVFIPLNVIVTVSLVVGLVLGKVEMQEEVNGNDSFMRLQQAEAEFSSDLDNVFVDQLPTLCLGLFQADVNASNFETIFESIMTNRSLLATYIPDPNSDQQQSPHSTDAKQNDTIAATETEIEIMTTEPPSSTTLQLPPNKTVQDMASYFQVCGQAGSRFRDYWLDLFVQGDDASGGSLTFNYIRCVNRSNPLMFNLKLFPSQEDIEAALFATQAEVFATSWKQHQQELNTKYLQDEEKSYTELEALTKSFEDATGEDKCAVNMPAAAWFWFTVMSTVGYGNAVPTTVWGRLIVYTLGFVSILMFGGMLGTAGAITTVLMNDFVHRFKKNVTRLRMVMVWGTLWLLWMLVIAHQSMSYKETRLQEEFPMNDAYWLSFISTTTVGFGDFYLEPEGLFIADLVGLWGNFLIGFVFLSAFLTELSNLLGSVAPDLTGDLQRNLKYAYDDRKVPKEILERKKRRNSKLVSSTTTTSVHHPHLADKSHSERSNSSRGVNKKGWSHPILRNRPQKRIKKKPPTSASKPSTPATSASAPPRVQVAKPTILNEEDNTNNTASTPTATTTTSTTTTAAAAAAAASPDPAAAAQAEEKKRQQQQQQQQQQAAAAAEQQRKQQQEAEQKRKQEQARQEAERQRQAQAAQQQKQKQQQQAKQAAAAAPTPAAAPSAQRVATFVNTGSDPAMAKAELYYKTTRWGSLGHGDPPVSVRTYPGDDWYIVSNGVYVKVFKIGQDAQQKFTI